MIEAIFELIFGFIAELVLETIGEILLEFGFHKPAATISEGAWNKILTGLVYATGGGVLGWLSLLIFPKVVFAQTGFAAFYFIVSPIVAGFVLMTVSWVIDRGINNSSWFNPSKFVFGVVFALGYSLSRLAFA
jgi:hypothetical protein